MNSNNVLREIELTLQPYFFDYLFLHHLWHLCLIYSLNGKELARGLSFVAFEHFSC